MNRFLHFVLLVLGHQNCSIATHVTVVGYGKTHLSTCDHPPFQGSMENIEARLVQIHIHPLQPPTGLPANQHWTQLFTHVKDGLFLCPKKSPDVSPIRPFLVRSCALLTHLKWSQQKQDAEYQRHNLATEHVFFKRN